MSGPAIVRGGSDGRDEGDRRDAPDELRARVASLSPEQRRALVARMRANADDRADSAAARRADADELATRRGASRRARLVAYYTLATPEDGPGGTLSSGRASATGEPAREEAGEPCRPAGAIGPARLVDALDERELERLVRESLPEYMCPARWVAIDAMPRLPNGKLAARLLPTPPARRKRRTFEPSDDPRDDPSDGDGTGEGATLAAAEAGHPDEAFATLARLLGELLGVHDVRPDDDFFELGGDSITAIQLVSRAREAGLPLDVAAVTSQPTLGALARSASARDASAPPAAFAAHGEAPPTPIQRWFLARSHPAPAHWNLAGVLHASRPLDGAILREAILEVLTRHPALGSRFVRRGGEWRVEIPSGAPPGHVVRSIGADAASEDDRRSSIAPLQAELRLEDGWLIRMLLVERPSGATVRLLWVAHHLILDTLSVGTLLSEIASGYRARLGDGAGTDGPDDPGHPARVSVPPSIGLRDWAHRLQALADSRASPPPAVDSGPATCGRAASTLPGTALDDRADAARDGAVDVVGSDGAFGSATGEAHATEAESRTVPSRLDERIASRFRGIDAARDITVQELLIGTLGQVLCDGLGRDSVRIDVEHHGRDLLGDRVDTSGSVGWFTSFFPFRFERRDTATPDGRLTLAGLRRVGTRFRAAREEGRLYLLDRRASGTVTPEPPLEGVLFNYQGERDDGAAAVGAPDAPWRHEPLHEDFLRAPSNHRSHALEVNAWLERGALRIDWRHVPRCLDAGRLDELVQDVERRLRELVESGGGPGPAAGYTPADFPDLDMDQDELDDFLGSLD